ncbi:MAG: DNA adenine methylase [Nitrosopumilus sp.]|nr:DNA adenine methylase [Nitrosopumilus sp.]
MKDVLIDLSEYPTTRYQGSKRKILPWLYENLKDLKFNTVLDGCGGSASVSYLFKKMNKSVTYNDNLKFNHIIGKALIENQTVIFTDEDIFNLLNSGLNAPNIISRIFNNVYYLEHENQWLDDMGFGILNMNHYTGQVLDYKKSIAYYALFQACLTKRPFNLFHRNNLNLRTADVKRNFGNKTTWEKDFAETFKMFVTEANAKIFNSERVCRSINESIFDIENVNYDLVYLDLPYINKEGTNETSNYLKCYHFLEGLVNYNRWENMIDHQTPNLRLIDSQADKSFNKESIYESFDTLINKFKRSKIVISYKKGGMPSIEYIVKVMKKYKKNVYTRSQHYTYALNKQNGNAKKNKEVLIIGI